MLFLTPTRKAYLLAQSRKQPKSTSSTAGSISRATGAGVERRRTHTSGAPPTSFKGGTTPHLEQQRTGASEPASVGASWSKRFSVASLGSWGEVVASSAEPEAMVASPIVKQDTGGGWGGWWGGGKEGGTGAGGGDEERAFGGVVEEIANA